MNNYIKWYSVWMIIALTQTLINFNIKWFNWLLLSVIIWLVLLIFLTYLLMKNE